MSDDAGAEAPDISLYDRDVVEYGLCGAARSRMLVELTADKPWRARLDEATVTFGEETYDAQILGTHSDRDDTFLWAWANPGAAQWGPSLEAVNALRALGEKVGYGVLRERKVAGEWVRFRELAWVAGELAGHRAVHFADAGNGTTAVMLIDGGPTDLKDFPLVFLPGVLLGFQPETALPMRACLERFLDRLGFVVEHEQTLVRATRQDGNSVKVELDGEGRVTKVQLHAKAASR